MRIEREETGYEKRKGKGTVRVEKKLFGTTTKPKKNPQNNKKKNKQTNKQKTKSVFKKD